MRLNATAPQGALRRLGFSVSAGIEHAVVVGIGRSVCVCRCFTGLSWWLSVLLTLLAFLLVPGTAASQAAARPVTVRDLIGLTRLGSQTIGPYEARDYAVRSPDGLHVAVVLQRGDLARNVVSYILIVVRAANVNSPAQADTVVTLASSSNRPGISHLAWLADNRTIAFIGERPGEMPRVYAVDIRTHALKRLSASALPVTGFTIAPAGDPILYTVAIPVDTSDYPTRRAQGFVVDSIQAIGDLAAGVWGKLALISASRTFVQRVGHKPVALPDPGRGYAGCDAPAVFNNDLFYPSIAPTGAKALIYCAPRPTPALWWQYAATNWLFHEMLRDNGPMYAPQPMILDFVRNTLTPLINIPFWFRMSATWAPDGRSVVLANAFLPVNTSDSAERSRGLAVIEVDLATHAVTVIAQRDSLRVLGWDAHSNQLELAPAEPDLAPGESRRLYFRKTTSGWVRVPAEEAVHTASHLQFLVDDGMNTPPRLVAMDPSTGRRRVVVDPNPALSSQLAFAHEEIIHWQPSMVTSRPWGAAPRSGWVGGLYYPRNYAPGQRYPLVIQTHGFDSTAFWPEGAGTTGYAAQALAARGMFVLQLGYPRIGLGEGPNAMASFESAADYLDSRGFIDRTRIGLMGWSRTAYHVKYAITHSTYHFAAAMVTDGVDFGYVQWMIFPTARAEAGDVNGGPPIGSMLDAWRTRAPGFSLDRVTTPLRITALRDASSLLGEWEFYTGLLAQHKPVELLYMPDAAHGLVKPQERLTSEQGAVDWFCFWLKGEEDPDPAKAEQYARWRELRKLQQAPHPAGDTTVTRLRPE